MKFKNLFLLVIIAASVVACNNNKATDSTHSHDGEEAHDHNHANVAAVAHAIALDQSVVDWKGSILSVKYHSGILDFTSGELKLAGSEVVGGSFVADLKSMRATDDDNAEGYGDGTKEQLIGHLSSPEFFDVESFPTASFEITSIEGNEAFGNLTVRGITTEETVTNLEIVDTDVDITATGVLVFDRQKYDVSWETGAKDFILSDDIELAIRLVVLK